MGTHCPAGTIATGATATYPPIDVMAIPGAQEDDDGRCPRHPYVQLKRFSRNRGAWVPLIDGCPLCAADEDDSDDESSSSSSLPSSSMPDLFSTSEAHPPPPSPPPRPPAKEQQQPPPRPTKQDRLSPAPQIEILSSSMPALPSSMNSFLCAMNAVASSSGEATFPLDDSTPTRKSAAFSPSGSSTKRDPRIVRSRSSPRLQERTNEGKNGNSARQNNVNNKLPSGNANRRTPPSAPRRSGNRRGRSHGEKSFRGRRRYVPAPPPPPPLDSKKPQPSQPVDIPEPTIPTAPPPPPPPLQKKKQQQQQQKWPPPPPPMQPSKVNRRQSSFHQSDSPVGATLKDGEKHLRHSKSNSARQGTAEKEGSFFSVELDEPNGKNGSQTLFHHSDGQIGGSINPHGAGIKHGDRHLRPRKSYVAQQDIVERERSFSSVELDERKDKKGSQTPFHHSDSQIDWSIDPRGASIKHGVRYPRPPKLNSTQQDIVERGSSFFSVGLYETKDKNDSQTPFRYSDGQIDRITSDRRGKINPRRSKSCGQPSHHEDAKPPNGPRIKQDYAIQDLLEQPVDTNHLDSRGRCIYHPRNQLVKKKPFGRDWRVMMKVCPDCATDYLRKSSSGSSSTVSTETPDAGPQHIQPSRSGQESSIGVAANDSNLQGVVSSAKNCKEQVLGNNSLGRAVKTEPPRHRRMPLATRKHAKVHATPPSAPPQAVSRNASTTPPREKNKRNDAKKMSRNRKHLNENIHILHMEYTQVDGKHGHYTGAVNKDFFPNGFGEMVYDDGSRLEGNWSGGCWVGPLPQRQPRSPMPVQPNAKSPPSTRGRLDTKKIRDSTQPDKTKDRDRSKPGKGNMKSSSNGRGRSNVRNNREGPQKDKRESPSSRRCPQPHRLQDIATRNKPTRFSAKIQSWSYTVPGPAVGPPERLQHFARSA